MTTTTTRALAPVIAFQSIAGAPVLVHDVTAGTADPDLSDYKHTVTCTGCLEVKGNGMPRLRLQEAREWGNKHAGQCRALPQGMDAGQAAADALRAIYGHAVYARSGGDEGWSAFLAEDWEHLVPAEVRARLGIDND